MVKIKHILQTDKMSTAVIDGRMKYIVVMR